MPSKATPTHKLVHKIPHSYNEFILEKILLANIQGIKN